MPVTSDVKPQQASADSTATLAAQGLDASDLEANRAGRMSHKQIDRQRSVRQWGTRGVWLMAGFGIVVGAVGAYSFAHRGETAGAVFMSLLGLGLAALPLVVLYSLRFADPAKVAACGVTRLENVELGVFLPAPNRGVYAISLNHRRYSGFASALSKSHLSARMNAYVVEQHRIVVALEPID